MERRNFLKQNMLATGALLTTSAAWATSSSQNTILNNPPFKCNYGIFSDQVTYKKA